MRTDAPAYELTVVSAAVPGITVADAKLHARIDHDAEDGLVQGWLTEAARLAEAETGRAFTDQTLRLVLDGWPAGGEIELPVSPVRAVTAVRYYAADGTQTTLTANTHYLTWLGRRPPLVYAAVNSPWPTVQSGRRGGVEVEFTAGPTAAPPAMARQAILMAVGYWAEHRGDGPDPSRMGMPPGAARLLRLLDTRGYR